MDERGLKQQELAEKLNDVLFELTGGRGTVSDRTIRNLLTGKTVRPQARHRLALEAVFGCTAADLGFRDPRAADHTPESPTEGTVHRRSFITATTATVAAAATATATSAPHRVGTSDVRRLYAKLAEVVAADDRQGGTKAVEDTALAYADEAIDLQQRGSASQRVRGQIFSAAAAFTSSAMWAAIDGRRLDDAQQHLNQAVTLAGLSADPAIQFRVWGHAGALYRQLGQYTQALAADEAAKSTAVTRRDPLYASLAHARTAVHQADLRDRTAALRSLGHAQDALGNADQSGPRPPWMRFYDQAELELLALIANFTLGRWAEAEAHAHRNLALLRPDLKRNRALALVHLAHAQLGQDALGHAVATGQAIPADARHGRTGRLLNAFGARLKTGAPDAPETQDWAHHIRQIGSTAA